MASSLGSDDNAFQVLINVSNDDPAHLQSLYENHRVGRNEQQRAKILAESFPGWSLDEILKRLDGPEKEDGFMDPRNCLVIWARPSPPVQDLISFVQWSCHIGVEDKLIVMAALWLMPLENLHTTVLEVAHSLTETQIEDLVQTLQSSQNVTGPQIAEYPLTHRARLLKPMVSFDASAMALSFVPAAGEGLDAYDDGDNYTYHHLRRDIFDMTRQTGLPVVSRYIVPSAHLTIARFITQNGFSAMGTNGVEQVDRSQVNLLVNRIDVINQKLQNEYWPQSNGSIKAGGEWIVGKDNGLVIRRGRLWYGGGETVSFDRSV
ncbi:hypothetical protein N7474_007995 [Penicillium riverlandense]|uniref:uncharacterized protein n=1 Tax=Penicillium riverlandense TaxID=1903569 RepID=UPI0025473486|nr:uncharacterized protein N7474_007995 [Penicillium riverlandense]KAJ5811694.1 hypothetical protein N7474_007995 [Penicillium riverlandense]